MISDYLLLSRVPRQLGRADVIILAGLHGPAIRAVEHLLYHLPDEDLAQLYKDIQGRPYFQAIFRVGRLDVRGGTTVPLEINYMKNTAQSLSPKSAR